MKPVRLLIVEDDPVMPAGLEANYARILGERGFVAEMVQATSVDEARKLAKAARSRPYDLVSLDVNLGDTQLTGMDVLDTLKRFRSAWMVVLLTGVETDASLDKTLGREKGDDLRKKLRRDAYCRFPAERLLVVEKPPASLPRKEAGALLANRIEQIALVYEEIGRLRYVFRPIDVECLQRVAGRKGEKQPRRFIETVAPHWQIRFDCGELRTLPDMAGFRTLHYLLTRERDQSVTPEEALAIEPKKEKPDGAGRTGAADPVADWFRGQGIEWDGLSQAERDKLVRAALALKFERYCELRGYQDEDDLAPTEETELERIRAELGPLADAAETGYQRMKPAESPRPGPSPDDTPGAAALAQDNLHASQGNYDRLGQGRRGFDSPAAALFRARMKRVKDCLRENGLADFARHLEDYLQSTGANWSYNPPEGIDWTT